MPATRPRVRRPPGLLAADGSLERLAGLLLLLPPPRLVPPRLLVGLSPPLMLPPWLLVGPPPPLTLPLRLLAGLPPPLPPRLLVGLPPLHGSRSRADAGLGGSMKASIFDGIVARLSMFTFVSKVYLAIVTVMHCRRFWFHVVSSTSNLYSNTPLQLRLLS
jgi:hypothetical protein